MHTVDRGVSCSSRGTSGSWERGQYLGAGLRRGRRGRLAPEALGQQARKRAAMRVTEGEEKYRRRGRGGGDGDRAENPTTPRRRRVAGWLGFLVGLAGFLRGSGRSRSCGWAPSERSSLGFSVHCLFFSRSRPGVVHALFRSTKVVFFINVVRFRRRRTSVLSDFM